MDLPTAIEKYWSQTVVAAGGLWIAVKAGAAAIKWLVDTKERETAAAAAAAVQERKDKVDALKLVEEIYGELIGNLREEVDRLAQKLDEVRDEMRRMMIDKDAQISLLEGEKRRLQAKVDAYRRILISHGWEDPEPMTFDALQVAHDGQLKTMGGT